MEKVYSALNLGCIINLQHQSGNSLAIEGILVSTPVKGGRVGSLEPRKRRKRGICTWG